MGLANGVHHLAICTADIKRQIEFFTDVLGAARPQTSAYDRGAHEQ